MGKSDFFKSGDYNALCDQCGKKFKFSKLVKTWDGFWVCRNCFEPRHPQDFVKVKSENLTVSVNRAEPPDTFTTEAQNIPMPE